MSSAEARAAERIAAGDDARAVLQRRVITVVVTGQVLRGAGLAAGITVGALLAQQCSARTTCPGCRPHCSPWARRWPPS